MIFPHSLVHLLPHFQFKPGMIFNTHILFSLTFSLIIYIKFVHTLNSPSFVLDCGNPNPSTDANGRKWRPDGNYLIAPETNSTSASATAFAQSQDPSLPSSIPYMTARIFPSQTTYTFPVSPRRRHLLRLHFYPCSSYNDFKPSGSYFSLSANDNFTLLKNFSALITSQALTQSYIIKEFVLIGTEYKSINLTFTPNPNSVAFVNGIEIIPIAEIFGEKINLVNFPDQWIESQNSVLQTMFRLNVGGQYIPSNNDSGGLGRTWYNDSPYIYSTKHGISTKAKKNVTIQYSNSVPNYIAPSDVYKSARTMGPTAVNYNLTWVFQVDLNFTYIVRLHFCEFQFLRTNERVFDIFINNQTAQRAADVMAWAGSKQGLPLYKDFAVYVSNNIGEEQLWIALHPSEHKNPEHLDAVLNGLEIFKVNDFSGNLAGLNPVPSSLQEKAIKDEYSSTYMESEPNNHRGTIIGGIIGGIGAFILVLVVVLIIIFNYKKDGASIRANSFVWFPLYGSSQSSGSRSIMSPRSSNSSSKTSTPRGGHYRHFTLSDIRLATKNFDENEVIGVGGFGKVYKGVLNRGTFEVAIKRSNPSSEQGAHEFHNEIDLLSKLRHKHLVSLLGACPEENEMILVYDYVSNGTLRDHICKGNVNNISRPHLPWRKRLEICIGAARGIHYLHTGAKQTIIHRDVKSTNILLDDKWIAKVSDFGLSKMGISMDNTHVSTVVKGSFGYLDPEYFRRQKLTEKSDVYSFGVVLFEVLCGRAALVPSMPKYQISLADWATKNYKMGTISKIIDEDIMGEINSECLNQFVGTAIKCLSDNGIERPSMGLVLWNLEFSVQLQDNPNGPKIVAEQKANDSFVTHTTLSSVEEEENIVEESKGSSSNAIFSMIMNQQGR